MRCTPPRNSKRVLRSGNGIIEHFTPPQRNSHTSHFVRNQKSWCCIINYCGEVRMLILCARSAMQDTTGTLYREKISMCLRSGSSKLGDGTLLLFPCGTSNSLVRNNRGNTKTFGYLH